LGAGFRLCALVDCRRLQPRGAERVAWWLTLNVFGLLTFSVVGDYFTPWMNQAFMIGVGAMMLFLAATHTARRHVDQEPVPCGW
jgi:hypothetical protein